MSVIIVHKLSRSAGKNGIDVRNRRSIQISKVSRPERLPELNTLFEAIRVDH